MATRDSQDTTSNGEMVTEYWVIERIGPGVSHGVDTTVENIPVATFSGDNREAVVEYCNEKYETWLFFEEAKKGDPAEAIVSEVVKYGVTHS
jgi:hypothetical protein